ncbi:MAG: hypothetical protein NVS9B1_21680 [Candidatus Dormibacteraceae bacterium]
MSQPTPRQPWALTASAGMASAEARLQLDRAMRELLAAQPGWALLSTCHRVELYGFGEPPPVAGPLVSLAGDSAIEHLLRVAAGLESAVIGEDEVLHQVRQALSEARGRGGPDARLGRLFETALRAGRRARAHRTASGIGLADRALGWLQSKSPMAGRPVVVAGAGRMGSALAHAARGAGAVVTIASRDPAKAARLADVYGGRGVGLAEGATIAAGSAAVAIALAGIWSELEYTQHLPPVADISAPSAVPESVRRRLNGGFLGIDDLFAGDRPLPRGYIVEAEQIVASLVAEYRGWLAGRP